MQEKRVVITGIGLITPLGIGKEVFWDAAARGQNGIRPITSFDTTDFKTKVGGEVPGFNSADYMSAAQAATMGRGSQFAVAAAGLALSDARIAASVIDPYRIGVTMGTTMGEPQILEQIIAYKYKNNATAGISTSLPRHYPANTLATSIANTNNIRGPVIMIPCACAAGNYAIGYAYDLIKNNRIDIALTGGSDPLSRIAFTGFNRLLATADDVVQPFDKNRKGMAVSEGCGILVLESLDHALQRSAPVYAEVLGYGLACDAYKMTIPDPTGSGGILALQRALKNAGIAPEKIDYISAHGTGTGENDKVETLIIKQVFGSRAATIPVSSQKSMLGHTMGAASAIEAAVCALTIHTGTILPTINYITPDPECDLDVVPNTARQAKVNYAVSNAYAFGGNTSSLILSAFSR